MEKYEDFLNPVNEDESAQHEKAEVKMESIIANISTVGCPIESLRVIAQPDVRSDKILKCFGHILRAECAQCLGIDQAPCAFRQEQEEEVPISIVVGGDRGGFAPFDTRTGKICE